MMKLVVLNDTDIAVIHAQSNELRVYRFDGTDWVQVGNGLFINGFYSLMSLKALNSTDVEVSTSLSESPFRCRWDGCDWSMIDSPTVGLDAGAYFGTQPIPNDLPDSPDDGQDKYRFDESTGTWSRVGNDLEASLVTGLVGFSTVPTYLGIEKLCEWCEYFSGSVFGPEGVQQGKCFLEFKKTNAIKWVTARDFWTDYIPFLVVFKIPPSSKKCARVAEIESAKEKLKGRK